MSYLSVYGHWAFVIVSFSGQGISKAWLPEVACCNESMAFPGWEAEFLTKRFPDLGGIGSASDPVCQDWMIKSQSQGAGMGGILQSLHKCPSFPQLKHLT